MHNQRLLPQKEKPRKTDNRGYYFDNEIDNRQVSILNLFFFFFFFLIIFKKKKKQETPLYKTQNFLPKKKKPQKKKKQGVIF